MNQKQFVEAKKQLEEERERLQKRVQELEELINSEKEILMKKNVPVEQMLKYLGYETLTREMLEEYVQGIYVYDDGRAEREVKLKLLDKPRYYDNMYHIWNIWEADRQKEEVNVI